MALWKDVEGEGGEGRVYGERRVGEKGVEKGEKGEGASREGENTIGFSCTFYSYSDQKVYKQPRKEAKVTFRTL